jgi:hypothetical protein
VYHGQDGTSRESPILKGFLKYSVGHGFPKERIRISLKILAIPAGLASPSNFKGLRRVRHQSRSTETKRFPNECLTFASPSTGSGSASLSRAVAGYLDTSPMARRSGGDCHHHPKPSRRLMVSAGAGKPWREPRMKEMQPVSDRIPISAPSKRAQKPTA